MPGTALNISTQRDIVKELQQVDEGNTYSTYGVVPTNPAFGIVGRNAVPDFTYTPTGEEVRKIGTEGRVNDVQVGQSGTLKVTTNVVDGNMIKWAFNPAGGGAGTIDNSKTFFYSRKIGGTETYIQFLGCLPTDATLTIPNRGTIQLSFTVMFAKIIEDTSGPTIGSGSYATPSNAVSWTHATGGSNPFVYNASAIPQKGITFTIKRGIAVQDAGGDYAILMAKAATKTISFSGTFFKTSLTLSSDAQSHTKRNATMAVGTLSATITGFFFKSDP